MARPGFDQVRECNGTANPLFGEGPSMTSARQIAANRENGRRSRGPRTAAGKASVRLNALKHGLAVSVQNDPAMSAQVENLARLLAGAGADNYRLSQARIVAEAQVDLCGFKATKSR